MVYVLWFVVPVGSGGIRGCDTTHTKGIVDAYLAVFISVKTEVISFVYTIILIYPVVLKIGVYGTTRSSL